jgi:hypothetical protein
MGLNWNEIKSRALLFSKTWADACNENSQAKPFWIDFFEIFGITDKRVGTFEQHVKKLGGQRGFMDLFWPGVLLVEHSSSAFTAFRFFMSIPPGVSIRFQWPFVAWSASFLQTHAAPAKCAHCTAMA